MNLHWWFPYQLALPTLSVLFLFFNHFLQLFLPTGSFTVDHEHFFFFPKLLITCIYGLFTFMHWRRQWQLQYSCLENPRDRGAWWAAIYGVAQSRTRLKRLSSSSSSSSSMAYSQSFLFNHGSFLWICPTCNPFANFRILCVILLQILKIRIYLMELIPNWMEVLTKIVS